MANSRIHLLENVHSPPGTADYSARPAHIEPRVDGQVRGELRNLVGLKGCMLLTIKDVMHLTGLGRTSVYAELKGPLSSVRVGRRRLVPAEALEQWRASLKPVHDRLDAA